MVLGMSVHTFILVHVVISLVAIVAGLLVMFGLIMRKNQPTLTAVFLATTVLTSASGFPIPAERILPSHVVGIISFVVLAIAIPALYVFHLAGGWRKAYIITSVMALYFNVFVLVVQSFQKIPALHALAPTQSEPPFAAAQLAVLALHVYFGWAIIRNSKSGMPATPAAKLA